MWKNKKLTETNMKSIYLIKDVCNMSLIKYLFQNKENSHKLFSVKK